MARSRLLSVREAAGVLEISPQRLRVLIRAGRIPAERTTPRNYVLREADVLRFAERERAIGRPPKESKS